jgi:hypothetical protein
MEAADGQLQRRKLVGEVMQVADKSLTRHRRAVEWFSTLCGRLLSERNIAHCWNLRIAGEPRSTDFAAGLIRLLNKKN